MSRTYKDKDFFLRFPEEKYDFGREKEVHITSTRKLYEYDPLQDTFSVVEMEQPYVIYRWVEEPGVKTKKPRHYKGDWKWYKRTPSWFVREFMTAPQRRECRDWESKVKYADDFEEIEDCPFFGKKPHIYYY